MISNKAKSFKEGLMIRILLLAALFSLPSYSVTRVHGYYKKSGTYVQPHHRSDPNSTIRDNWSTRGNVNPYTGKPGTRNPASVKRSFRW